VASIVGFGIVYGSALVFCFLAYCVLTYLEEDQDERANGKDQGAPNTSS
jgi:hypothetical protein